MELRFVKFQNVQSISVSILTFLIEIEYTLPHLKLSSFSQTINLTQIKQLLNRSLSMEYQLLQLI